MNIAQLKLGKLNVKHDPRTFMLANYLTKALPPAPAEVQWQNKVTTPWGIMLNDNIGCCTIAGAGHMRLVWSSNAQGKAAKPTDAQVLNAYKALSGYDPKTGANDDGCVELDVLNYWRKTGIAGDKIGAFAATSLHNIEHIKSAIQLFGGLYIGLELPVSAQTQTVWDVIKGGSVGKGRKGSWGGHCVNIVGYNATGPMFVSWGKVMQMTWAFFMMYCSESYAIISQDFINQKKTPIGVDLKALQDDLKAVA